MNIYTERLVKEWRTHGKIVLSVDFDSTIYPYPTIDNQKDIERTIRLVQLAHAIGAYIVIFTASEKERFKFIQDYCDSIKIPVSSINENPIELPYGKNGKIFYNLNICDRSGISQALDILEEAINQMQKQKD